MREQDRIAEVKGVPGVPGASLARELWGETCLEDGEHVRWCVLHTLPRQEKALGESLEAMGARYYLPMLQKVSYYGHRKRTSLLPMFPSYLFLWGTKEEGYRAVSTKRVAKVIEVGEQARLDRELQQVRRVLIVDAGIEAYGFLTEGRPVRVISGPMKGVEGLVESMAKADRLILRVSALGQAISVQVHPSLVEPL